MLRTLTLLGVSALLLAGLVGCGEKTEPRPFSELVNLRNGTWITTRTVTASGPDSCDARAVPTVTDTTGLCYVNPASGGGFLSFFCTVDQADNSEDVTYECTASLDLGPCRQTWTLSGDGTVTDTTFTLLGTLVSRVEGDSALCAQFVDACTSRVTMTGTFWSEAGKDSCDRIEALLPLSDAMEWIVAPALTAP